MDSDTLGRYTIDTPEEEDAHEGADDRLPLHHLRPCEFGADRIPAAHTVQDEGEQAILCLPCFFLIGCNPTRYAGTLCRVH